MLGRREEGVARRDQEGLPQARAAVPPRPQPGRRAGRGALQGGPGRLRRARRPREAQAVRPRLAVRLRRRRPGGQRRRRLRPGRRRRHPLQPLRPGDGARRRRAGRRRARRGPRPSAAATSRPRSPSPSTRPSRARRSRSACRRRTPCAHLPRHGRQAGDRARGLPALPGPRRGVRGAGPVLDQPALLALRRRRRRHRGPVPDLPRQRRRPHDQEVPREHPRRRAGRLARASGRQGRAGTQRRRRPATSTSSRA